MASLFKPIKSFLTIVVFLVLTAIVAVVYGGSETQQARMENNFFYQKSRLVLDTIWTTAQGLAGLNLNKNLGYGDNLINQIKTGVENNPVSSEDTSVWSGLFSKIKTAWQNSGSNNENNSLDFNNLPDLAAPAERITANPATIFIDKTDLGSQLVLQSKSGKDYRINLPFKKN